MKNQKTLKSCVNEIRQLIDTYIHRHCEDCLWAKIAGQPLCTTCLTGFEQDLVLIKKKYGQLFMRACIHIDDKRWYDIANALLKSWKEMRKNEHQ
jgi:hypothetical protein